MKRNLRFWTRFTLETMEANLILTVILAVLAIFSAEGLNLELFASVVPYLLCIGALFGMLLVNISSQSLYVPLLLSMGETRRNVFFGFHYYRILIIAVTAVLCTLIWLMVPGDVSSVGLKSLPTLLCVLIMAAALGSILGTIFIKLKWLGTIILVVLCGCMGGIIGATGVSMAKGLAIADTLELAAYLMKTPWWLVLAALVFLVLDLMFQWLILRRQEVRF